MEDELILKLGLISAAILAAVFAFKVVKKVLKFALVAMVIIAGLYYVYLQFLR
jgi:hypothetical protein